MTTKIGDEYPEWARDIYEQYLARQAMPKCKYQKILDAVLRMHVFTVTPGGPPPMCECGEPAPCKTVNVIYDTFKELQDDPTHTAVHRLGP